MLKYILIAVGLLFALWLVAAIRKIASLVKSGEFQQALEAKRAIRELVQRSLISIAGRKLKMERWFGRLVLAAIPSPGTTDR
jgi:hypothetical protein